VYTTKEGARVRRKDDRLRDYIVKMVYESQEAVCAVLIGWRVGNRTRKVRSVRSIG
jgi:hypothetical protein